MAVAPQVPPLESEAEGAAVLARRLRIAIALCVAPIMLFALFDLRLVPRDALWSYWGIKLAALAVVGVGLATLRGARARAHVVRVGLACIAALFALSTLSAAWMGEGETTPLLTLAVALATATLLPWGAGPQMIVVLLAGGATVAAAAWSDTGLEALLRYPSVGLAIGLAVSVYVAAEFEASRRALRERQAGRARAEQEVRRLNERLEARVAARTAELERVNRALQAEVRAHVDTAAALRRAQASALAVIENADDAIWAIDRTRRLTACNAAVRQRFAAAHGCEMPAAVADFPAEARALFETFWAPLYDRGLAGERFTIAHALPHPGGERHYVTSFNPIVIGGAVSGLAIFSSDVTERRRAEEAARQHQAELTHVLRLSTMGEMAAGLAHEINQPLAAIVNYARGSARRLRDDPGQVPAVLPVIDSIASEALRAGEIIRRLRHLVRKEAARQDWVDVNELVAEAVRVVAPEAHQQGVTLDVYPAPALPRVLADAIQIEQVVLNLLRNAIEAMAGAGGRLQVTTRAPVDAGVELSVRDTGPGLGPAVAERLFEPFVTTKPSGLGMGLSISRTIVESHHGRLWVTPNPDRGVTFRVHLPLAAPPADRAARAAG